jgi:hypothetical protein
MSGSVDEWIGGWGVMGVLKEQGDANALTAYKMMGGKMITTGGYTDPRKLSRFLLKIREHFELTALPY